MSRPALPGGTAWDLSENGCQCGDLGALEDPSQRSIARIEGIRGTDRRGYFQIGFPLPGKPRLVHISVTRSTTLWSMRISRPHSRLVSGGHLLVASRPSLPPSPLSGEAKSR